MCNPLNPSANPNPFQHQQSFLENMPQGFGQRLASQAMANLQAASLTAASGLGQTSLADSPIGRAYLAQVQAMHQGTPAPAPVVAELPKVDMAGPLIAYRYWKFENGYLKSLAYANIWIPGRPMYGEPQAGQDTGVYSCKKDFFPEYRKQWTASQSHIVAGEVAIWGKVIETEHGYKAEFAYPRRFIVQEPMAGFPMVGHAEKWLGKRYGVPVWVGRGIPEFE